MFQPTLSQAHAERAITLRRRLAQSMEGAAPKEPGELAAHSKRLAEVRGEIGRLEGSVSLENLEAVSAEISRLNVQVGLLDGGIVQIQARAAADQRAAEAQLERLRRAAAFLLGTIALDFIEQHRDHLAGVIGEYTAGNQALAANVVRLVPWFLAYSVRATNLRDGNRIPSSDVLLSYLAEAQQGSDFLAPTK